MRRIPKVLYEIYGDRVRNLRQLVLEVLASSFMQSKCQCRTTSDNHSVYCAKCDPSGYLLRDDDHAEYWKLLECSYGVVSKNAPPVESFTLENRWTQRQIIERAVELLFRQETRPRNVICFGYQQPRPNHRESASISAPYGLECTNSNSATRLLNSEAWMVLLSRVGDMFMLHLLLHTYIFCPLSNNSYLQIAGAPVSSLVSSSQPHELVEIEPASCDATVFCKTSCVHKEDLSTQALNIFEEVDKTIPFRKSTVFSFDSSNSTRSRSSRYICRKDCEGAPEHRTAGCKKRKLNIDRRLLNPNKLLDSSSEVCRSGDYYDHGSSSAAAWDFDPVGHVPKKSKTQSKLSVEHAKNGSGGWPCLNNKCPVKFSSISKSDSKHDQFHHQDHVGKTEVESSFLNLENIPLEVHHFLDCNDANEGGQKRKRSRLFSWQRRKLYKTQERFPSSKNTELNSRLKDNVGQGNSRSHELHSAFDVFNPSENCGDEKSLGLRSPSKTLIEYKIMKKTLDKADVSDQLFSLKSCTLSLDIKEDECQKEVVLRSRRRNKLSDLKDECISEDGNINTVPSSSCWQGAGNNLLIPNIHNHSFYIRMDTPYPGNGHRKCLMTRRKCIIAASNMSAKKNYRSHQMEARGNHKYQQAFSLHKFDILKKSYSQSGANLENPVDFEENAEVKGQDMVLRNSRCVCWLASQTRHMHVSSMLINRRRFFYNSRFLHHFGFPKYHILNVIKPNISGAKQLLAIIFGIPASFIHEHIADITGVCESSCPNWSILSMLKDLIRNAQHCNYRKLLTRHCPVQVKQPTKDFSMPSSKIMDSLSSVEGYGTQDKETLSILHGNTDKGSKSVAFYPASCLQALPRCNEEHAESDCLLHSEPLNDQCLFNNSSNLESQHVNLADRRDEESHATGSLPKNSSIHGLLVKRRNGHCNSEIKDRTNEGNSKYSNMPLCKYMKPTNSLQNEFIKPFSSHTEVVSFLWAVCRRIIPEALIGSKRNWRTLRSNLGKFVRLRRFENFTLRQCMHKVKTSHFPWLNGATSTCQCYSSANNLNDKCSLENSEQWAHHCGADTKKNETGSHKFLLQEKMLANWIYWFFSGLIVPLIQAHFYVTETENGRQNVFYFQKNVWAKILNGAVKDLTRRNYKRLSAASLASILQKRSFGFSRVRILPKSNGVRPIANLGAPSTTWLQLHKNPVQPVKRRKINSFRKSMLILDRVNGEKCQNERNMIETSMQVSIDNLQIRDYQDAGVEGDFLNSNGLISDKLKGNFDSYGSDSKVKVAFRSVNSLLCDVHQCLKFEQENCPEALGCSVFDYNDIYLKFIPFVLGLKDYCMGQPKLYIAVCDVARAFDTVDQDKLLDVVQGIVQKEQYFVQRYTKVSCGMKSLKVTYERHAIAEKGTSFKVFSNKHSSKQSQGVFIDQAFLTVIKKDKLLGLIHEHVKRNILQIGPHFYIQKVGIPQGSVLSSLLCSFYFGHLDRNKILPLLGHTQKQQNIVSQKTMFGDCMADGFLPRSKVCNEGSCLEAKTTFFEEMNKNSGVTTRCSRWTGIKETDFNAELSACASDIAYHHSSDNVNEHKLPKSILLRLIDDLLFISTSKEKAVSFIASMHRGFKDYNCFAKKCKTSLNFEMDLEGENMPQNVYKGKDGSCFIRWSGILINCHTLEIQADYTRYSASHISSTLTVWREKNPGYYLMVKLCQFMRPKCHPIFYDSNINSPTTVRLNAYQAFLLCAMKFHSYICSVPSVGAFSPKHAFQTIMKSIRYMYKLVKQRLHNMSMKTGICAIFTLQQKEIEWLGLYAYRKVLKKKQSRYRQLLSIVEAKLRIVKYRDLVESADLRFAVDDCRSCVFWQIKY